MKPVKREPFVSEAEQAILLNPNNAHVIAVCGLRLVKVGEWDRGQKLLDKAMRLNPHHPGWYSTFLGITMFAAHRYEEAIAAFSESANTYPEDRVWMAAALAQQQNFDAARKVVEAFIATAGPKPWWSYVPTTAHRVERDPTGLLTYMSYMYPYKNRGDREHLLKSLRSAGF